MLLPLALDKCFPPPAHQVIPEVIQPLFDSAAANAPLLPTLLEIINSLGFDSFGYSFSESHRINGHGDRLLFTTTPPEWIEICNRRNYIAVDPRFRYITESVMPALWDQQSERGRSAVSDECLDQMSLFGLRSGLVFQFHDVHHCGIVCTLNSHHSTWNELRREMVQSKLGDIMVFAKALHQYFMAPQINAARPDEPFTAPLTPREREVYTLAAAGHDTETIATMLGIAKGTAQRHIDTGRSKLGAANRTQAIVRALRNGEIVSKGRN